jgi:hypothetical protein
MNQTESVGALAKSLSKAQGEIENASKDSENTFFKNAAGKNTKYASLAEALTEIRPAFSRNGLSILQVPCLTDKGFVLVTRIMHESGEWIEGDYPIEPVKKDPQGYGGAVTYARRYSAMAFAGIAPEDDDGNDASGKTGSKEAAKAVADRKIQETRPEAPRPNVTVNSAATSRESFITTTNAAPKQQVNVTLTNLAIELGKLYGDKAKEILSKGLAKYKAQASKDLDLESARSLAVDLYDEAMKGHVKDEIPGEVKAIWSRLTDIASVVKEFQFLKDLLGKRIGTATAETEYRGVLSSHGVMHSNEFRGAEGNVKARSAARQLWELISSAERDSLGITEDDVPV